MRSADDTVLQHSHACFLDNLDFGRGPPLSQMRCLADVPPRQPAISSASRSDLDKTDDGALHACGHEIAFTHQRTAHFRPICALSSGRLASENPNGPLRAKVSTRHLVQGYPRTPAPSRDRPSPRNRCRAGITCPLAATLRTTKKGLANGQPLVDRIVGTIRSDISCRRRPKRRRR